jgi:hypothetical protein
MKFEYLFVIIPAAILFGLITGMMMIRSDVIDGSEIMAGGTLYKCERIKSGY